MFKKAKLEVVEFSVEDVISTSGGTTVVDPGNPWGDDGGDDTTIPSDEK